jgi:hypothetical protein
MSWLIDEESIDRYVLDDLRINEVTGNVEQQDLRGDEETTEWDSQQGIEIVPPIDYIMLRNNNSEQLDLSNIIIDEDQESIYSGMTIIPSCSSSSVISQPPQQSLPSQDSSNGAPLIDESEVALSIDPNSIDTSILTELSGIHLISSVVSYGSKDDLSDDGMNIDCCENVNCNQRSILQNHIDTHSVQSQESIISISSIQTSEVPMPKVWYDQFESEEDWERFHEKTNQLLDAVSCPDEERDELIAQLINMEEEIFWKVNGSGTSEVMKTPSKSSWLLEVIAVSASIAVAGMVVVRILKGR